MSLSRSEFKVLSALAQGGIATQRQLAAAASLSLGSANRILHACELAGWASGFSLTPLGAEMLAPYKEAERLVRGARRDSY